jgi:hypothetical protein
VPAGQSTPQNTTPIRPDGAARLSLGLAIGDCLGTLGGGGSILAVPILVYALGQTTRQATTTSLIIVAMRRSPRPRISLCQPLRDGRRSTHAGCNGCTRHCAIGYFIAAAWTGSRSPRDRSRRRPPDLEPLRPSACPAARRRVAARRFPQPPKPTVAHPLSTTKSPMNTRDSKYRYRDRRLLRQSDFRCKTQDSLLGQPAVVGLITA